MTSDSAETSFASVKRAAKTYGRVREPETIESEFVALPTLSSNRDGPATSKLSTNPLRSALASSLASETELTDDEDEAHKQNPDASSAFQWGWKKQLLQMDEDSDDDDVLGQAPTGLDASTSFSTTPGSPPTSNSVPTSEYPHSSATALESPPVGPHRRPKKKTVIADSDSESEDRRVTRSPFSSPQKGIRKDSSPPTSGDDLPDRIDVEPVSKGKAKATTARDSSFPAQLDRGLLRDKSSRKPRKASKTKIKAPTKKELAETEKDRFRLAVNQQVFINKTSQSKFTLANLFDTINADVNQKKPLAPASSDPIISFSSSPGGSMSRPTIPVQMKLKENILADIKDGHESDSDDLPDVSELLRDEDSKKDLDKRQRELRELKQRALARQKAQSYHDDDSDDDLEIVESAKPVPKRPVTASKVNMVSRRGGEQRLTQGDLNARLAMKIQKVNADAIRTKEEEWTRRGGKLVTNALPDNSVSSLKVFTERRLAAMAVPKDQADMDEDGSDTDEDWTPDVQDGASPIQGMDLDEPEGEMPLSDLADTTLVDDEDDDDENDENLPRRGRSLRRPVMNSDSEEENNENENSKPASGKKLVDDMGEDPFLNSGRRESVISTDESSGDDGDKENNTQLMYDRSEDKENKAVVQHLMRPPLSRHGSIFALEQGMRSQLSMSPTAQDDVAEENDENRGVLRKPFGMLSDDDPFQPRHTLESLGPSPMLLPSPSLKTFHESDGNTWDDNRAQLGFSQLFKAGTEQQTVSGGLFNKSNNDLGLSQDATTLQPAFEVTEKLQRQADSIFEDEQRYLLEAANSRPKAKEELYVNEHGFLTQTRPTEDAEVYLPAPTPPESFAPPLTRQPSASGTSPASSRRLPLQTISLTSITSEPEESLHAPLTRLRRGGSPGGGYRSSATPPPPEKSAFDVLQGAQKKAPKIPKEKTKKIINSEFVEAEAQESDEEEYMFGLRKGTQDDDEDGEDLDASLATLVDDSKMDEDVLAVTKVQEKYQEHLQQDDEEIEKLHRAAVQGRIREKKRNRNHGFVDSDDEDEEDDANADIRRRMNKRSRIERGDIKEFAGTAYFDAYRRGVEDDDDFELAYLQSEDTSTTMMEVVEQDYNPEESESNDYISRDEVSRSVRELAEQGDEAPTMDMHDVSWIDEHDLDEMDVVVKSVTSTLRQNAQTRKVEGQVLDGYGMRKATHPDAERDQSRMQAWAKAENKVRHVGPGRTVSGAAITGHGKKVKAGGGSLRQGPVTVTAPERPGKSSMKAAPSMLAEIEKKARGAVF